MFTKELIVWVFENKTKPGSFNPVSNSMNSLTTFVYTLATKEFSCCIVSILCSILGVKLYIPYVQLAVCWHMLYGSWHMLILLFLTLFIFIQDLNVMITPFIIFHVPHKYASKQPARQNATFCLCMSGLITMGTVHTCASENSSFFSPTT